MASNNLLNALTGGLPPTSVSDQLKDLESINNTLLAESMAAMQTGSSGSGSGSGAGGLLGSVAGAIGGGLGLTPLISGIAGLFGGGSDSSASAAPIPYMQPQSISLDAGFSDSTASPFGVDSAQGNTPRPITSGGGSSGGQGQITVQVQALDSQSFLDHSNDIAMAVRQAMLETTVLNDVIREV